MAWAVEAVRAPAAGVEGTLTGKLARRAVVGVVGLLAALAARVDAPGAVEAGVALGAVRQQAATDAPRVLSARDVLRIARVGDPRISPDGGWVLYTRTARDMDDEELKATTHIWRVAADGSGRRQMTRGEADSTSPRWFPDGKKFAFLSARGETRRGDEGRGPGADGGPKRQVYAMYLDGGEAWRITDHEEGVQTYEIAPDGNKLLFTARDPLSEEERERRKRRDDAEVVDEVFRMSHLWVLDLETGESRRLTEGDFTVSDAHWSPDSTRIVYVARPTPKVDDSWKSDVWVVEVATGESRKLFENPGTDANPRWSPDGRTIAFASDPRPFRNTWYEKLYLIPAEGGEPRELLEDFDRNFSTPIWSPDGATIYFSTGDRTTINLFAVDVATGAVEALDPPRGRNSGWQLSADGRRWVWVHAGPTWPAEVYTAELAPGAAPSGALGAGGATPAGSAGARLGDPLRLSDANPWLRQEGVAFGAVEVVRWRNSDGQEIEGVLTWPVGYEPGRRYPLILNPHGGPSGARIESFSAVNQFFAGNGFLVLEPNFRGSSNYGQEFLNANRRNWGIVDYDDCISGVDYCVAEGWADPERMVAYGWSYGGYMSFWISTQTDRFKLVSPGAGLSNLYSMYSTTDIPGYMAWFFGTPWENEDLYRRHSPIRHVAEVRSRILILHGAEDARVPPEQSVEFYRALRDLGRDVTFVRYPREGHGIREPRHQVDRLRRWLHAFAEAVGIEPVSEEEPEAEVAGRGAGILEVALPPSDPGVLEPDPGTFGDASNP